MAPSMPNETGFFASRFSIPQPGDVIVYEAPDGEHTSVARVIAEGGQTVEIVDDIPHVDGQPLERQLIGPLELGGHCYAEKLGEYAWAILDLEDNPEYETLPPVTVPPGHYYVLGDNRDRSNDSRWIGTIPGENVRGVLAWIYRPGMGADTPACRPPEP